MTAESTASTELPAAGTYRIHPEQSTVCYRGRHMFGLDVVNATFRINSGENPGRRPDDILDRDRVDRRR